MEIPIALVFIAALIWGTSKPLDAGEKVKTSVEACLICIETGTEHEEHHPMEKRNGKIVDTEPASAL